MAHNDEHTMTQKSATEKLKEMKDEAARLTVNTAFGFFSTILASSCFATVLLFRPDSAVLQATFIAFAAILGTTSILTANYAKKTMAATLDALTFAMDTVEQRKSEQSEQQTTQTGPKPQR